jgi:D-glycero-D-manno-heptose 1,7-bisphosphate phosphatase
VLLLPDLKLSVSKAIFLDRDGTINEEVNYLSKAEDIRIYPNTPQALRIFKDSGFLNIIITNQSGIARGYFTEKDLNEIHIVLKNVLAEMENIPGDELIDDIFYSPYHIEGVIDKYKKESDDRKPDTGLIRKAQVKYNIDLKESFFVGDSFTDMLCARNAGLKGILVETGYGLKDIVKCRKENIEIEYFAKDLLDASMYIRKLITNKNKQPESSKFKINDTNN